MHDDAKHLDTHSDEMQEMLGTAISKEIKRIADKEGYCPECATLSLLEVVACMATMTGISVEEAISTATAGAESGEAIFEFSEEDFSPSNYIN